MTDILTAWQFWAAIWAVCGWLAYGAILAHFQREFPIIASKKYNSNKNLAILYAISGPIGFFMAFLFTMFETGRPFHHGFMWRVKK